MNDKKANYNFGILNRFFILFTTSDDIEGNQIIWGRL